MHQLGLVSLDEVRRPSVASEQLFQFLVLDTGEDGRVGNLVAVEMKDRQHRPVGSRIEKLVGMPCGSQRSGFRLAIANDASDNETGIVEHGAERMTERIAQLTALVDRARALRRYMAGDSSGKRKLKKKLLKARLILADVGINLAVSTLEIRVAHDGRAPVPGAGDVNHVEVVFFDEPVQVDINEVLPGGRAPVPEQHVLHIRQCQRPLQQRIVAEINLGGREIVGGAPVGVHLLEQFRRERVGFHGLCFRIEPRLRTRVTDLAIIASSLVRMTRTLTRPASAEISGAFFALRFLSSSMPRKPSSLQILSRLSGAFSPMPPAKTSVSNPPSAAAKEPIHFFVS